MQQTNEVKYEFKGGPKGYPILGMLPQVISNPLGVLADNALKYGDYIPIDIMGMPSVQLNHPALIRHVLIDNHKNYRKSAAYIRFESAIGEGLLTSYGEKWRRDRQAIQPFFKREQIEGYYFGVSNEVSERCKQRWLKLTENGPAELNLTKEMACLTMEIVLRTLFGKTNIDDQTVDKLYDSFGEVMVYLRDTRVLPRVDFRKIFHHPAYYRFRREMDRMYAIIDSLSDQYKEGKLSDQHNMLAMLLDMQRQAPEHFTDQDIKDQSLNMIFGGFETTANTMQWMWYILDSRPDIRRRLRDDILQHAASTGTHDTMGITHADVMKMQYLHCVLRETHRMHPPFWMSSREPLEDDWIGDYKIKKGTVVVLPQLVMQCHPRFWDEPNAFIPERFEGDKESKIDPGLYFPFSLGPRKCIGNKFAEMEAKTIMAKLVPLFHVQPLNVMGNPVEHGISHKHKYPLQVKISRI